jgi:hypothetical protein
MLSAAADLTAFERPAQRNPAHRAVNLITAADGAQSNLISGYFGG